VEEDGRVRIALELLDHRLGECTVDRYVSLEPRVVDAVVDARSRGEVPEMVLEKPQHRVGDDVVEPVVRLLVVRDHSQAVGRAVTRGLLERFLVVVQCDNAILVGHSTCDPRDVVMQNEAAQSGDEPSATSARDALAAAPVERHGAAVGNDDQIPAGGHAGTLSPAPWVISRRLWRARCRCRCPSGG
jgi:hypothetical protein